MEYVQNKECNLVLKTYWSRTRTAECNQSCEIHFCNIISSKNIGSFIGSRQVYPTSMSYLQRQPLTGFEWKRERWISQCVQKLRFSLQHKCIKRYFSTYIWFHSGLESNMANTPLGVYHKRHHGEPPYRPVIMMIMSSNGNNFCFTGYLCGETGHQWIPHTKAGNPALWCFL